MNIHSGTQPKDKVMHAGVICSGWLYFSSIRPDINPQRLTELVVFRPICSMLLFRWNLVRGFRIK